MSIEATFGQANHSLTIIGQQEPTAEHLRVLHDGYLADLVRAIKLGTIPARYEFQKFLGLAPDFHVWCTIKLGTGLRTAGEFGIALKQAGCRIGDWGSDILGKPAFTASRVETEVDLVALSVAELGFKDGATRKDIYERAIEIGLELCPAEVGPQLRLQYKDQPNGERLLVAMNPIADSGGGLNVFNVERSDHDLWLSARSGRPDYFGHSGSRWVFRLPRK
ncbi:MAG: hypothetical protein WAP52_02920 [Candidatus Sungiibacteriota bacterium]